MGEDQAITAYIPMENGDVRTVHIDNLDDMQAVYEAFGIDWKSLYGAGEEFAGALKDFCDR